MITTMQWEHLLAGLTRAMPVLLDGAVKSGAVLAIAWMIVSRMRGSSAALRHLVWFGSLASLLVLPMLSRALPAWRVLPESWDVRQVVAVSRQPAAVPALAVDLPVNHPSGPQRLPAMVPDRETFADAKQTGPMPDMSALSPAVQSGPAQTPPVPSGRPAAVFARPLSPWAWIGLVWLGGATLLGLRLLLGLTCLLWASLRLRPCGDPDWCDALAQSCRDLGIRRRVRLLLGRGRAMPMTWGILRPHLLVPAEDGDWSPQRRRVVLLHELAHVKRWDCLTQLLAEIACAVCWFNPLAWMASRRMQNEAERACDDLVLARGSRPAEYAGHLLEIAVSQHQGYLAAAMAAIPMARDSKLEGRLLAILDGKRSRRALTLGVVILSLALLAGIVVPVAMLRAAEQAAEARKAAASTSAVARLADGLTVEVAGVGYHPSEGRQWWGPGGTVGPQYAFVTSKSRVYSENAKGREFVLRLKGEPAAEAGFTCFALSSNGSASGPVKPVQGPADGRLEYVAAMLPPGDKTATIRVGVATGPWTTVADEAAGGLSARSGATSRDGSRRDGPIIFSPAYESDGGAGVSITHLPVEGQVRIVAIDGQGQEHATPDVSSGSADGISQTTAHFAGLPVKQVKSFRLQSRPYQWITFRNVSLEPGRKTDVQAEVGPAVASQPAGKPSVSDASQARRLSMNNMQQILRGIWVCMPQKNGQWPDDLPWPQDVRQIVEKGLHKTYDESSGLLSNPERPAMKPAYIYLKPAVPISRIDNPGRTVTFYEAYDQWGEGINVGFLDGHVTFMDNQEAFQKMLRDTEAMYAAGGGVSPEWRRVMSGSSQSAATEPAGGSATQPAGGPSAASSQSQPAAEVPVDEGITVAGIVTDELGHPRANVQFGQRFPSGLWKGPASDANGRFTLKGVTPDKMQWIAYSQATKRMALFTLPADASDKPIHVKLNLREGELEGRVVDANGHGVPKAKVRLRVRTPDGQRYLSDVFPTDADGYYDHDDLTPVAEGLVVEAALASHEDEEDAWQCRTVLEPGQIDVAMPELVDRDAEPKPGPAPASPRVGFGGRVVDEQGKPIAGAKVEVCYSLPGENRGLWSRRTSTGADGRWMRHLPRDMKETFMRLFHPQYVSGEQLSLPATDRMRDGSAVFVMKKGLRISGTVRSRDGDHRDLAGALAAGRSGRPRSGPTRRLRE